MISMDSCYLILLTKGMKIKRLIITLHHLKECEDLDFAICIGLLDKHYSIDSILHSIDDEKIFTDWIIMTDISMIS